MSRRRCCLCAGLKGDFSEKRGQIAHLNRDSSNYCDENLAFLCLPHHDEYDSCTSQSKGLTIDELKYHRKNLYESLDALQPCLGVMEQPTKHRQSGSTRLTNGHLSREDVDIYIAGLSYIRHARELSRDMKAVEAKSEEVRKLLTYRLLFLGYNPEASLTPAEKGTLVQYRDIPASYFSELQSAVNDVLSEHLEEVRWRRTKHLYRNLVVLLGEDIGP